MKKSLFLITFLTICAAFLIGTTPVMAASFTFNDTTFYWGDGQGWASTDEWTSSDTSDNSDDVIGAPEIGNMPAGGGSISWNGTSFILTEVFFDYDSYNSFVTAGDLFIDVGADLDWDYVVSGGVQYDFTASPISTLRGGADSTGDTVGGYELSNKYFTNESYREDHPVKAIIPTGMSGTSVWFKGFDADTSTNVEFGNAGSPLSIDLGNNDSFIIGFSPTCANDVIYEKVPTVPEPGPMLLFGAFMIGMATIGKKKYFKK